MSSRQDKIARKARKRRDKVLAAYGGMETAHGVVSVTTYDYGHRFSLMLDKPGSSLTAHIVHMGRKWKRADEIAAAVLDCAIRHMESHP